MQGVDRLTVFVKATFTLRNGASATPRAPLEIVREDRLRDGWGGLEEAAETAPYLPSAGVIARGHACAPEPHAVTALRVRLALYQPPRWTLNKVLHVYGDRTRSAPNPQAFQRMPIVYERAYGARHIEANPVGQGSGEVLPNILDPADPARPAGFGPIAAQWAPRKHLGARSPRLEGGAEEINPAFDFRYFHAAPADQQIEFLRGDEWIFLEGMHPKLPSISSSLPSARGAARLYRTGPTGVQDQGELVNLVADTLVIDADRLICSVVWRGNVALRPGDTLARMRVLSGVELAGQPIPWPMPEAPRPAAIRTADREETLIFKETAKIPAGAVAARLEKPIAPFALAEPSQKSTPSSNAIPGAPWSPVKAIPPGLPLHAKVGDETLSVPDARSGTKRAAIGATTEATTIRSTGAEAAASRGLPFAPAEPRPPRAEPPATRVPSGLPFAPAEPPPTGAEPPSTPRPSWLPFVPAEPPPVRPETSRLTTALPFTPIELPPPKPEPVVLTEPREEPAPPAVIAPPAFAPPPAAESPAPPPLFVLGKTPEPVEPAPPESASPEPAPPSIPPPPSARAVPSIPPPPPARSSPSIPPPPPVNAAASTPASSTPAAPPPPAAPPLPAAPPPEEAEGKDLRSKVIARLKRGEALHDLELAGAELEGVDFSGALLERRSLSGAKLDRCNFTGAKLTGADMRGVDLTDANLTGAELTSANLSRATLDRARFQDATLSNADLSVAKGSGASFEGSSLKGVNLRQARLPEGVFNSADLSGANASKADFSQSTFRKANLSGASLRDAKLKQTVLAGANVDRVDMRDADLTGANVHGVNLAAAKTNGAILRDLIEEPPPE